jgi:outer membrane protein OmpA-like peptidoglycan-associated protein
MMCGRRVAIHLAPLAAALVVACAPKRISEPTRPGQALIVLLPDSDTGKTGAARVSNRSGSVDLAIANDATMATMNRRPGPIGTLTEADVKRFFGDVMSALPPAPRRFTLYFLFESDELTDESRALVPEILSTVKGLPVPEVVVVGHTDTMGTPPANIDLGYARATTVLNLLVAAGLDISNIAVASHGETDLLVHTPDETPEPRNRRVEIAVR